jgi:hypothetical protein
MQCPRCAGLMNYERFFCGESDRFPIGYDGLRCLCCGEIIDPLILLNRSAAGIRSRKSFSDQTSSALYSHAILTGRDS